jgi:hypothetical protein
MSLTHVIVCSPFIVAEVERITDSLIEIKYNEEKKWFVKRSSPLLKGGDR